ncbi:MAG: hypothetical protein QOF69_700, partial [Solirubrobacteraceae bacterium]|nr:hypothetical protein [Solirubrobacteraceae bacterium]
MAYSENWHFWTHLGCAARWPALCGLRATLLGGAGALARLRVVPWNLRSPALTPRAAHVRRLAAEVGDHRAGAPARRTRNRTARLGIVVCWHLTRHASSAPRARFATGARSRNQECAGVHPSPARSTGSRLDSRSAQGHNADMPEGKDANGRSSRRASDAWLMRKTSRRRSLLEMLVCALLVAAFAGQPAIGDKDAGKIGVATAATSGASSKAAPARHSRARSARVHSVRAAQAAQSAQPPTPPTDPAPAEPVATSMSTPPPPPPPPVAPPGTDTTPPPPPPVEPAASAPEAGAGDSAPTPPVPTPAPAAEQQAAPRALVPGDAGARPAASRGASAVETPADAQPETIQPASGPTGA